MLSLDTTRDGIYKAQDAHDDGNNCVDSKDAFPLDKDILKTLIQMAGPMLARLKYETLLMSAIRLFSWRDENRC